ncbi:AmmeMemoRadiSam system protein A [Donghicola sp. C2-DW-16]|uniref:AmmeMemoRadiSam system protein A n=1 Tax=Donghicola mangrovi TaxID=2729614 RepID=A0ABX2PIK4_9RHOB|nr:AmmeMemoRadiSam system protein A [Donghicola mangrovi]NVO29289.1 AmmeMemoRadiSam system protein A [Donghicola mangrovi]
MTETRALRFAGSFFPRDPVALRAAVTEGLAQVPAVTEAQPRAVISAHAGYSYSGRFTGMAIGSVPSRPKRVVVLSPSHRYRFQGVAFPPWAAYDTGLGVLPLDRPALHDLAAKGLASEDAAAHDNEHGIETQLPFLAARWPGMPVVPLVMGATDAAHVAAIIDHLASDGTLFLLSSDLSHFLNDTNAKASDATAAEKIERGETGLTGAQACGALAINGWMASSTGQGTKALRLGMGNSGAVTKDLSRVLGYGAWAFYGIDADMLADRHRATLLRMSRQALEIRVGRGTAPKLATGSFAAPLQGQAATFVTLTQGGRLRGCIGILAARRPMMADVAVNTQKAALEDPRFPPVTPADLPDLSIKIAVLSRAAPLPAATEAEALERIEAGKDGLILQDGAHRGTLLPAVWESLPDPVAFLRALKRKAGLPEDHWSDSLRLMRYRAETFGES